MKGEIIVDIPYLDNILVSSNIIEIKNYYAYDYETKSRKIIRTTRSENNSHSTYHGLKVVFDRYISKSINGYIRVLTSDKGSKPSQFKLFDILAKKFNIKKDDFKPEFAFNDIRYTDTRHSICDYSEVSKAILNIKVVKRIDVTGDRCYWELMSMFIGYFTSDDNLLQRVCIYENPRIEKDDNSDKEMGL